LGIRKISRAPGGRRGQPEGAGRIRAGGDPIPLTAKGSSASSPRWSPDARYLAFLAARNEGETQVWLLNRLGGEAEQLTEVKQGVGNFDGWLRYLEWYGRYLKN